MPRLEVNVPDLYEELPRLLAQVPRGRVTTYGDLAAALGSTSAARWAGESLREHVHHDACTCHRVVRSTGELGPCLAASVPERQRRLESESIEVAGGRVNLERYRFREFESDRPLARLSEYQQQIPDRLELVPFPGTPEQVAAVDLSYSGKMAFATYALVETAGGRLVWSETVSRPVAFPYIPGFLTFRELPVLLELVDRVRGQGRMAPLVLVDGTGILHPRRAGIAANFGVVTGLPTIGVSKKLLCGQVDLDGLNPEAPRRIIYKGEVLGTALQATERSRPVFVSPGNRITVDDAARIARLLFHGHRLPEPIYWADRLSREAARS